MAARLAQGERSRFKVAANSELNVTPLVDVMLVLLIIFMVAAPTATRSLKLDLPPASFDAPLQEPTVVSIQRSGALYVGQVETSPARLAADLNARFGVARPTTQRVLLRADAEVPYERMMGVMNALQAGGYRQVALVGEDFGQAAADG